MPLVRDFISHRLDSRRAKLASYLYAEFADHGFLRHLWTNEAEIDKDFFRSNHPSPRRLRRFKEVGGRTIINLRAGQGFAQNVIEKQQCAELGLDYICIPISSVDLPQKKQVLDLISIFETAQRPVLMHCKSGADRTGIASGIYELHMLQRSPSEAAKQLTIRHAHLGFSEKAVLREFFKLYEDAFNNGVPFLEWVNEVYDPRSAS